MVAPSVGALIVGRGGPAAGAHRQRTGAGPPFRTTDAPAPRRRSAEPPPPTRTAPSGGSVSCVPKNSTTRLPCSARPVEQRPHEFLSGVDLCPLRIAWRHFSSAARALGSSWLLPQPGPPAGAVTGAPGAPTSSRPSRWWPARCPAPATSPGRRSFSSMSLSRNAIAVPGWLSPPLVASRCACSRASASRLPMRAPKAS